jgi:hypothetical protein
LIGGLGGDPALRRLAGLKLRGLLRKRLRRVRRPANAVFAVIGLALMGGWLSMIAFQGGNQLGLVTEELVIAIQAGALLLVLMTSTSALSHRGLYLPPAEIELLLSAPVSRQDLVRYRVLSSLGRALFGGIVIGIMAGRWMPQPVFGFLGAFVATLFLPLIGQGISLLSGSAENRLARWLGKLPFRWMNLAILMIVVLVAAAAFTQGAWGGKLRQLGLDGGVRGLVEHPVALAIGMPFRPWAMMMTARELPEFLSWLALNVVLWTGLFELVARIPVDFRELSLSTSADIARRLRRHRRGGAGINGTLGVSKRAAGRRVPWLFGRGPFGAIAWRKSCSILRKARGTLLTGAFIIGLLTLIAVFATGQGERGDPFSSELFGPALIAGVGTLYLCAGLRFDFREDLEQMEVMKSWPMSPWRLFLATLVPEVMLVSLFVTAGIALFAASTGGVQLGQVAIALGVPLVVLLWTSIDNAVFLYAPIRYTPGQEGALHHTGRALTLMLLRMLVFAVVSVGVGLAIAIAVLLESVLGLDDYTMRVIAAGLSVLALLAEIAFLIWTGGRMFRRFDLARDTG